MREISHSSFLPPPATQAPSCLEQGIPTVERGESKDPGPLQTTGVVLCPGIHLDPTQKCLQPSRAPHRHTDTRPGSPRDGWSLGITTMSQLPAFMMSKAAQEHAEADTLGRNASIVLAAVPWPASLSSALSLFSQFTQWEEHTPTSRHSVVMVQSTSRCLSQKQ